MHQFMLLITKIFPLYVVVLLGFLAGKRFAADRDTIATLLIYFIGPVVIFNGVASAPTSIKYLGLPAITLLLACTLSIVFYGLGKRYFSGAERNLVGFMSGTGNTGYFGLPVVLALFGVERQNIAILATLGFVLFENTLGYYYIARHSLTAKEAVSKLLRLPAIYAYTLGVIANVAGYHPSQVVADNIVYFRGAYVILGMLIIGIGLSTVTRASIDKRLIAISFAAKFVAFPAAVLGLRAINSSTQTYDSSVMDVLLQLSVVPIASNTVAFATKLKAHPEKAAFTVLASTIFALVYIPIFTSIFIR
jgi:malate permease and related proteins